MRTVRFGNHPELVATGSAVAAEQAEAFGKAELVFVLVLLGEFTPIARDMAREELHRVLSSLFESGKRPRSGHQLSKVEQGFSFGSLHENFSFELKLGLCSAGTAERCMKSKCLSWRRKAAVRPRRQGRRGVAFIGTKWKPLTEEAGGSGAGLRQERQTRTLICSIAVARSC